MSEAGRTSMTISKMGLLGSSISSSGEIIVEVNPEAVIDPDVSHPDTLMSAGEAAGSSSSGGKLFFCPFCTQTMTSVSKTMTHLAFHFDYSPVKCLRCSEGFADMDLLTEHHLRFHTLLMELTLSFEVREDFGLEKWIHDFINFQVKQSTYIENQVLDCSCANHCPVCLRVSSLKPNLKPVNRFERNSKFKPCDKHGGSFFIEHLKVHLNYYPFKCLHCEREGRPVSMVTDQEHAALAHMGMRHSYIHRRSYVIQETFPRVLSLPQLDYLIRSALEQRQSMYTERQATQTGLNQLSASQILKMQRLMTKEGAQLQVNPVIQSTSILEQQQSTLVVCKETSILNEEKAKNSLSKEIDVIDLEAEPDTGCNAVSTASLSSSALPVIPSISILPKTIVDAPKVILPNGQILFLSLSQAHSVEGNSLLQPQLQVQPTIQTKVISTNQPQHMQIQPMVLQAKPPGTSVQLQEKVIPSPPALRPFQKQPQSFESPVRVIRSISLQQQQQQVKDTQSQAVIPPPPAHKLVMIKSNDNLLQNKSPPQAHQPQKREHPLESRDSCHPVVKKKSVFKPFDGDFTKLRVVTEKNGRMVLKEIPEKKSLPPPSKSSSSPAMNHFRIEGGRVVNLQAMLEQAKIRKQQQRLAAAINASASITNKNPQVKESLPKMSLSKEIPEKSPPPVSPKPKTQSQQQEAPKQAPKQSPPLLKIQVQESVISQSKPVAGQGKRSVKAALPAHERKLHEMHFIAHKKLLDTSLSKILMNAKRNSDQNGEQEPLTLEEEKQLLMQQHEDQMKRLMLQHQKRIVMLKNQQEQRELKRRQEEERLQQMQTNAKINSHSLIRQSNQSTKPSPLPQPSLNLKCLSCNDVFSSTKSLRLHATQVHGSSFGV